MTIISFRVTFTRGNAAVLSLRMLRTWVWSASRLAESGSKTASTLALSVEIAFGSFEGMTSAAVTDALGVASWSTDANAPENSSIVFIDAVIWFERIPLLEVPTYDAMSFMSCWF